MNENKISQDTPVGAADDCRPVDELTLMRLVDGQITNDQLSAVIARLERQPDGWQACALAFLEDQAWRQAMSSPSLASPTPLSEPAHLDDNDMGSRTRSSLFQRMAWGAAIAAALLLAFACGVGTRSEVAPPMLRDSASQPTPASAPRFAAKNPPKISIPRIADNPVKSPLDSPLYVLDRDFWKHESTLTPEFRKELESAGATIRRERGLMPIRSNDGRKWIVPYEEWKVVPVQNVSM